MSSTLIVRDATLAINGAPEKRGDPALHLRERLAEVEALEAEAVQTFAATLAPSVDSEGGDVEALEAMMLLGEGHPRLVPRLGISPVLAGRRLATCLEREGRAEFGLAVLEFMVERHPGQRALERDLAALMRRQGMVNDLVDRYLERARGLLRQGRTGEAIAWLREVLLLDRSRKDVARMIRDLRYQELDVSKGRKRRLRTIAIVLSVSLLLSFGALREVRLREAYEDLPTGRAGDLASMRGRLAEVEEFVAAHPAWHGTFRALEERTRMRVDIAALEEQLADAEESRRKARNQRMQAAELARERGLMFADAGEYASALEEFRRSLELATEDWPARARVERDVAAITQHLEGGERQ